MPFVFRLAFALALIAGASRAAPPIFPLKNVKPGLRGECRTTFAGDRVQPFPFEVLGVGKDFAGPGRDIIWCKMLDDPTKQMVVAGGMSGSPCFIEGRNMGALAYGWLFNKDPIFGVQPIESMLELFEFRGNARGGRSFFSAIRDPLPARPSTALRRLGTLTGFPLPTLASAADTSAGPLPLPLEIGGLPALAREPVGRALREAGFFPIFGGGGGKAAQGLDDPSDLVPGSPLTGVLARGDLNMAATGTLTWRDNDRVLAFGHPFLGVGAVAIPMGKAEIVGIVSSYERSFKMANKGPLVGLLTQDRMSAVAGFLGRVPRMVPMTVRVTREGGGQKSSALEFCDNKFFTLPVYQTALLQLFANVMERSEEGTLALKSEVRLKGASPLVFEDTFAGERGMWAIDAALGPSRQLGELYANDFVQPEIESISVEAAFRPAAHQIVIEQLSADVLEARPGESVRLRARFRPWRGARFTREFEVRIPEEAKSGEVQIVLADAAQLRRFSGRASSRGGASVVFSGEDDAWGASAATASARALDEVILALNDRRPSDRAYLLVTRAAEGLNLGERHLPALPASVRKLMAADSTADTSRLSTLILSETQVPMQARVEGSRSLTLRIP
ncbi:MAG: hypothetical protein IT578_04535 [Verrucomicrobiae bacterium]|nr:hypothetical protein [Verrucomicrobiae bacterium]